MLAEQIQGAALRGFGLGNILVIALIVDDIGEARRLVAGEAADAAQAPGIVADHFDNTALDGAVGVEIGDVGGGVGRNLTRA